MTSTAIGDPAAPATDSAGDGVVLRCACGHALRYLQSLPSRPVAAVAGVDKGSAYMYSNLYMQGRSASGRDYLYRTSRESGEHDGSCM